MKRIKAFCLIYLWSLVLSAASNAQDVIFITLDGIQMSRHSNFQFLNEFISQKGLFFGTSSRPMVISNTSGKSLPGYRAILSGTFESECTNNRCSPIERETIFDHYSELGLTASEAVVFASWEKINNAIAQDQSKVCGSISFSHFKVCSDNSNLVRKLYELQVASLESRPKWNDSRWDHYTWSMALEYLKQERPRLTYISLVDTDEWAHHKKFKKVESAIFEFKRNFEELLNLLKSTPGRLENTSFVITTDHGRARGPFRFTHGKLFPSSKKVFAIVVPSENIRKEFSVSANTNLNEYSHIQIRPTLEMLLNPHLNGEYKSSSHLNALIQLTH